MLYVWLAKQAAAEDWKWKPGEEDAVERELRFRLRNLLETDATEPEVDMRPSFPLRKLSAVAASVLLVLGLGIWYHYDAPRSPEGIAGNAMELTPLFESHKALVIQVAGKDYFIDSLVIGEETIIGQLVVKRLAENSLSYQYPPSDEQSLIGTPNHRLYVPKGRDFNVKLPDGSSVWLNTESALEFPTVFAGGERQVAITGEAFFEVASDKANPFVAIANEIAVIATGTQFNVKAYHDESTFYTTLIEGVVTLAGKEESKTMTPNQQAVWQKGIAGIHLDEINVANIIAKKNGYFAFYQQDIRSVMKEISRWYDVEVFFQGEVSERLFGGTFSRSRELGELLEYFESIGEFKFKRKGRRIIVMS